MCFRYVGRKRLQSEDEPDVKGSKHLVWVGYSYWTLGYLLSNSGAKKLLDASPLTKLLPVDEYLPIMFDRHPE
jgi:collagen beta-1,O-galactosyltransferase